jgi:signal transduction histidine kinase
MAIEAVKFQAERKHVDVDVQEQKEGVSIQADRDKTTWVLVNLLTNAIRYSPENGKVVVRCKGENARPEDPVGRGKITFSVEDHGPGIDKKYLTRIFEKFFQVPGSPTGTGLGLAISKEFIEAQGGSIHVESTIGQGSVFSFDLPKG